MELNDQFGPDAACKRLPDGTLVDLAAPGGGEIVTLGEPEGLHVLRHSAAHVMAQAVVALFPGAKYAIGPAIQDPPGFYYDFDVSRPFTAEDLVAIEAKMKEIISTSQDFVREEVSLEEAARVFADQPYKLEIIEGIGEDSYDQGVTGGGVSIYRNDSFVDLCRGPHLPSTGRIPAFRVMRSSGAYWRGDEKNKMLQRIYGTAWESQEALEHYLHLLEEAEKRDHVKLGRELELFASSDLLPAGMPIWLPKGSTIRRILEDYIVEEEMRAGYQHVYTPHLGKRHLYEVSGHWEHYQDNMYPPIELEREEIVLRPMNCPHHILIYKSKLHSYRDLPIRIAELGGMYRFERSGVVRGLSRVRFMTLNDAHIFCTPDQVKEEFGNVVRMVERVYSKLGITDYGYRLSLRDPKDTEKYHGDDAMWDTAEEVLREALQELGVAFTEAEGEAAFYGPKLDIQLRDVLGREETYSTVQLDFLLPARFDLTYVGEDGNEHQPVMIHRGVISTLERIVSYLIELYGGAFPTWLAPTQAVVIPIAERHNEFASAIGVEISTSGVRVVVDDNNETLGNRIRKHQMQKVPYMLIVGDREVESRTVSIRARTGVERKAVPVGEFLFEITQEIAQHRSPESSG